jgi:hypothetical protein
VIDPNTGRGNRSNSADIALEVLYSVTQSHFGILIRTPLQLQAGAVSGSDLEI